MRRFLENAVSLLRIIYLEDANKRLAYEKLLLIQLAIY